MVREQLISNVYRYHFSHSQRCNQRGGTPALTELIAVAAVDVVVLEIGDYA